MADLALVAELMDNHLREINDRLDKQIDDMIDTICCRNKMIAHRDESLELLHEENHILAHQVLVLQQANDRLQRQVHLLESRILDREDSDTESDVEIRSLRRRLF